MRFGWKYIVLVLVGWMALPLAAFSGEEDIIRARDFDEYLDRVPFFKPLTDANYPEFPITIGGSQGTEETSPQPRTTRENVLESYGGARWCFSLQVDSLSYRVVEFDINDDAFPFAGIAELHCQIIQDHLFREEGEISIYAVGVDVPDKLMYSRSGWDPESVVGRTILASGHYESGMLGLNKQQVYFIGPEGDWENPNWKRYIEEILLRRKGFIDLENQFRQSHTVIIGRLISDTPTKTTCGGEPVSFSVDRILKGEADDVAQIYQYSDPWSCVSVARLYLDVPYLLFLKNEVGGRLILENGRNNAFAVLEGQVFGSSGFPFAQLDSLEFWVE